MGHPLVHPQRLGSLVGASNCTLVRDEQGLVFHFQSSASCWGLLDWACSHRLVPLGWVVCILQNEHQQHMLPWVFIPRGLLLVNIFGFFIDTCNWPLGN